jgi:hypothetical protein
MADAKKACDAKDGEIAVLKKQVADAAITPEKLDVMVKDRLAVSTPAKSWSVTRSTCSTARPSK